MIWGSSGWLGGRYRIGYSADDNSFAHFLGLLQTNLVTKTIEAWRLKIIKILNNLY